MRILLIEDDQVIANFIQKGMKEAGFTIDHFDDGSIGLHAALTGSYDVGILDLMLPHLDGLSILDRLRKEKRAFLLSFSAQNAPLMIAFRDSDVVETIT